MENLYLNNSTIDYLDGIVTRFAQGYTDLIKIGGENYVLDAALQAYVDYLYRIKIGEICNVPAAVINDEILRFIQSGAQSEKLIENGKLALYRRSYSDDEIRRIVSAKLNGLYQNMMPNNVQQNVEVSDTKKSEPLEQVNAEKTLNDNLNKINKEEEIKKIPENDNLEKIKNQPIIQEKPKEQATINKEVTEESSVEKPETISPDDLLIDGIDESKGLIAGIDEKSKYLMNKYSSTPAWIYLGDAIKEMYKVGLSKLTGIAKDEIKDFVCDRISAGISDNITDENGNITKGSRPLTDEEAILITTHINNLSEEEIDKLIGESVSESEGLAL